MDGGQYGFMDGNDQFEVAKMKVKGSRLFVFLLIILVFTGCTLKEPKQLEQASLPLERQSITPSLINTSMSLYATSTFAPTMTLTPSLTPSTIPTIMKLTSEEFHNLLLPDMACRFPCWWGIEPGITTIEQTNKQIESLGMMLSKPQNQKNGLVLYQDSIDLYTPNLLSNMVNIYTSNDIVSTILISASSNYDESFWKIWSHYSPQLLLRQYNPNQILLLIYSQRFDRESGEVIYRLIFLFNENKAMVEYSGITKKIDGTYQICPNHSTSGNLSPYIILKTGDFNGNFEGFFDLEKASAYDLETIIEGIQSSESYCVTSDKSFWQ